MGFGLSLANVIVKAYGVDIMINNSINEGSEFIIIIPINEF
jgi:K+-sensing histidine kinase KdpD